MYKSLKRVDNISVNADTETTILSHTAVGGEKWAGFSATGQWSGKFKSKVNGVIKDSYITSPEARTAISVVGQTLNAGEVLTVTVEHDSTDGAKTFDCTVFME